MHKKITKIHGESVKNKRVLEQNNLGGGGALTVHFKTSLKSNT